MNLNQHDFTSGVPSPQRREIVRQCGNCRTAGYPEDVYCARCGKMLPPACRECGTLISHPIAFHCVRCGRKLGGSRRG